MIKITSKTKYVMPKCLLCNKRYRLYVENEVRISFSFVDEQSKYHRETYVSAGEICPKCKESVKRMGWRKALDIILKK